MQPKVYNVEVFGRRYMVKAMTKGGAVRALIRNVKSETSVELADVAEVYAAGARGEEIIEANFDEDTIADQGENGDAPAQGELGEPKPPF